MTSFGYILTILCIPVFGFIYIFFLYFFQPSDSGVISIVSFVAAVFGIYRYCRKAPVKVNKKRVNEIKNHISTVVAEEGKIENRNKLISEIRETDRDGNFIAFENDVVYDTETGLEWFVGPDMDTTWDKAKSWVRKLSVDGGGWRMPTGEELQALYKENTGMRNMTPMLRTTGWVVWSGETKDSLSVWLFSFSLGHGNWHNIKHYPPYSRSFAVRSHKTNSRANNINTRRGLISRSLFGRFGKGKIYK